VSGDKRDEHTRRGEKIIRFGFSTKTKRAIECADYQGEKQRGGSGRELQKTGNLVNVKRY